MTVLSQKQTTIIRAPRDKEHPYFSLRRKTAQDTRLSFEARGALAYLLSRPGNWDINLADLQREGGCGRDRALRILNELETCGYLIREAQTFGDKHRFNPVVLVVQEAPRPENPVTDADEPCPENPITDDPITDGPITENSTHTYKRESQKEESGESSLGVDQKTEDEKTEESTTTPESVPPATDEPQAVVVDAGDSESDQAVWDFIQADVAALGLSAEMDAALRALGPAPALAIALAASKPHIKSPGGLAVSLIKTPENIPPALLEQAVEQLVRFAEQEAPAPEPTPEERRADYEQLQADTRHLLAERAQADPPGDQESKNDTLSNLPGQPVDDGLNFHAPGHSLTIRDAWGLVMGNVPSLMGPQSAAIYRGVTATQYAGGVLLVQAPSPMARDLINQYRRSWGFEMTKLAGVEVEVKAL